MKKRFSIFLFLLSTIQICVFSQPNILKRFTRIEINFEHLISDIIYKDLNNNNFLDLVVITEDKKQEKKRFRIFFQSPGGEFNKTADWDFKLDKNAIVFDIDDIIKKYEGKEILYLTKNSLNYYYLKDKKYVKGEKELLNVSSIFLAVAKESPIHSKLILSLGNKKLLAIPGPGNLKLFSQDQENNYSQVREINSKPFYNIATNLRTVSIGSGGFANNNYSQLIVIQTQGIFFKDFNGDKEKDIICIYKDKIHVFLNHAGQFFTEPDSKFDMKVLSREEKEKALKPAFTIGPVDINGNGLIDFVVTKTSLKMKNSLTKIYIYLNKKGKIEYTPDQIIILDNCLGFPEIVDLNGNGQKDLIVDGLNMGLFQILKLLITQKVNTTESVYLRKENKYDGEPDFILKSKGVFDLDASTTQNGEFHHFKGDLNGDSVKDLINADTLKNRIFIHFGNKKLKRMYQKNADFTIKEQKVPHNIILKDLNGDRISDLTFDYRYLKKKKIIIYLSLKKD